jgi:periplasmic protein TonB
MHPMSGSIFVPRVPLRFIVVAAAHVGLFYIVNGALRFEAPAEPPPMIGELFDDWFVPPDTAPEVFPEPFEVESITVDRTDPPPPIDYEETPEPPVQPAHGADAITARTGGSAEMVARFVPVRADPDHPLTRAPYPPGPIREDKEGVVELAIHVLRNGSIAEVKVAQSSGDSRLDRAAVEEARRHWRLKPAMRGGEAIDAWGSFRVVFRLDRR